MASVLGFPCDPIPLIGHLCLRILSLPLNYRSLVTDSICSERSARYSHPCYCTICTLPCCAGSWSLNLCLPSGFCCFPFIQWAVIHMLVHGYTLHPPPRNSCPWCFWSLDSWALCPGPTHLLAHRWGLPSSPDWNKGEGMLYVGVKGTNYKFLLNMSLSK